MQGLIIRKSVQGAKSLLDAPTMKAIPGVDLKPGDIIIGATPVNSGGAWRVTFTALVSKVRTRTSQWELSCVRKWEKAASWELPRGVVPPPDTVGEVLAVLPEGTLRACTADLGALRKAATSLQGHPLGFSVPGQIPDEVTVVFRKGDAEVWLRKRCEDEALKDPAVYRRVLEEFLRSVPGSKKGFVFEDLLKELFRAVRPDLHVPRERQTRDGGRTSISFSRRNSRAPTSMWFRPRTRYSKWLPTRFANCRQCAGTTTR
jgi:hypothetical protein